MKKKIKMIVCLVITFAMLGALGGVVATNDNYEIFDDEPTHVANLGEYETFGGEPRYAESLGEYEIITDRPVYDASTDVPMKIVDIAVDGPITDEMLDYGVPIRVYADGVHIATVNEYIPNDCDRAVSPLTTSNIHHRFPANANHATHRISSPTPGRTLTYSWNITSTSPSLQGHQIFGQIWYSNWGLLSQRSGFSGTLTVTPAQTTGIWSFAIWNASNTEAGIWGTATLRW